MESFQLPAEGTTYNCLQVVTDDTAQWAVQ